MEVHYDNKKLEKKCANERAIRKNFPNEADRILERLQDLNDYPNLQEYLDNAQGNPHPLKSNKSGWLWVHINGPNLIIFEPLTEIPTDDDGKPKYSEVVAVNILHVNISHTEAKKLKQ